MARAGTFYDCAMTAVPIGGAGPGGRGAEARPRCARICSTMAGSCSMAIRRSRPPHWGHASTSMPKARCMSAAQVQARGWTSLQHRPDLRPAAPALMALTVRSRALGDSLIAVWLPECDRIAWRSPAKQEQPRTPRGDPYPRPRSQPAAPGLPWQALKCGEPGSQTRSCAGMRWSVPELGTKPGTDSTEGGFRSRQLAVNKWWAGTGLNRRHQDFQFSPLIASTPWLFNDLLAGGLAPTVTIRSGRLHPVTWSE